MVQTFDTSRQGGGTYQLEQDSDGNYKLKSVGFEKINKLNLPDLKTSDTQDVAETAKKAAEETIKKQTTEVFRPSNIYQSGKDDQQLDTKPMLKEPEVKEATVRQAGEPMVNIAAQQIKADKAAPQESIGATDSIKPILNQDARRVSQYQNQKPISPVSKARSAVQDTVSSVIDSVKNNRAIKVASNVLSFASSPIIGGLKMVAGSIQESPQDKFNKGYFNSLPPEEGGRIAGNPADNVFAGMNAVSLFGNVRTGALNRIDKRNKTSKKLSGDRKEKFDKKTKEFEAQVNKYDNDRAAARDKELGNTKTTVTGFGKSGFGRDTSQGGGDTGQGGGGRVICTELHRTKELSTKDWIRDTKFTFKTLSITHVKGYLLWAEPTVKHIQKYPRYRKIWKHIAQHRANDIAWRLNEGKFDLLGRIYAGIGEPVCWMLGNFVSDKQISKYNLTHWRRA